MPTRLFPGAGRPHLPLRPQRRGENCCRLELAAPLQHLQVPPSAEPFCVVSFKPPPAPSAAAIRLKKPLDPAEAWDEFSSPGFLHPRARESLCYTTCPSTVSSPPLPAPVHLLDLGNDLESALDLLDYSCPEKFMSLAMNPTMSPWPGSPTTGFSSATNWRIAHPILPRSPLLPGT